MDPEGSEFCLHTCSLLVKHDEIYYLGNSQEKTDKQ